MLFAKYKYTLTLSGGTASVNTDNMRGMIEQLIITPTTSTTGWDLNVIDKEGDYVYQRAGETGTINDRTASLPVGRDGSEKFTVNILNGTANEVFKIIFKVREKY